MCRTTLDLGESESIALAKELDAELLIMDERKGRAIAEKLKIRFTGTLGVIVKAKQSGILSEVRSTLLQMTSLQGVGGFHVSSDVIATVLKLAGE
jgi:predicted nucleic acid-binding protein